MSARPSEPLLAMLRQVAKNRGLNTAALAAAIKVDRAALKQILAGREPLTVDQLIGLAQVLELSPTELGAVNLPDPGEVAPASEPGPGPAPARGGAMLAMVGRPGAEGAQADPIGAAADPDGNHAEQIIRLGLALGCDIHLVLVADQVQDSGVPRTVLSQFKDRLPIRLDAAFHRHHDLRFLAEGVCMTLSFDALYTCQFPWTSILQVTLFPLPPSPPEPEEEAEEPAAPRRGHLRLVD